MKVNIEATQKELEIIAKIIEAAITAIEALKL